jgi:AbrB family looped-hinge helix DNA binding protein
MNATTKLSAKGQIVIHKDVRDRMGLEIGDAFEVFERGSELVLRRGNSTTKQNELTVEQAVREIQNVFCYSGPPISIEDMDRAVRQKAAEKYEQFKRQS